MKLTDIVSEASSMKIRKKPAFPLKIIRRMAFFADGFRSFFFQINILKFEFQFQFLDSNFQKSILMHMMRMGRNT